MYAMKIEKSAAKFIKRLDKSTRGRIIDALLEIQETPYTASNVKKLTNGNRFRKRVGDYRIIYRVYDDELIVSVIKVGNRGDIYKHL
ncbi:type II toxin-antitoxin system RelE family toxin [Scopulibacillus cellulosilyticus]|uniref:Type II toxin-antitoxin system RelE/ParE family toxin n=1 Tax=Scopulibacillus cellulosilyticus TaxID=2665665 RepID=A0ABW2Q0Y5_9BACL